MRAFVVVAAYTYQLKVLADVINNISHIGEDIPPIQTSSRTDALALTMNDWESVYLRGCFLGKGVGQFWETFKCKGSLCVTLLYPYCFAPEIMKLLVSSSVMWILSVLQDTLATTCSKCWLLQFVNCIFSVHRNNLKLLLLLPLKHKHGYYGAFFPICQIVKTINYI